MTKRARRLTAGFAACAGTWMVAAAGAVAAANTSIYTCADATGKRITSDRVIAVCAGEQRELNADGSLRRVVPPLLSLDERTEQETREREAAAERARQQEAFRSDRGLLARYPNEAAHRKAREAALDDTRKAVKTSEERVAALAKERKPLSNEAEFYVGKALPPKLKQALDANDAATEAQQSLIQNQQVEVVRINRGYDAQLEHLRKLWAGAKPGTIGPPPSASLTGSATPAR